MWSRFKTKSPRPTHTRHSRQPSNHTPSVGQPHRQYGDIAISGAGLTINGDVYTDRTLFQSRAKPRNVAKLGLCLGSAPQIDPAYFVGRVAETDAIHRFLFPKIPYKKQQRLVLGGMGGVGKTQLAIAYAERHWQSYDTVFWLNATSQLTLHTSLRLVAGLLLPAQELETLTDEQVLARILGWLSDTSNTRWLLIFDNYDEPTHFDISRYCPYAAHGSVIITTRLPDYVRLSCDHLRLQPLNDTEESLDILCRRSRRTTAKHDPYARRLAQRLAGLPLALSTAGAYLSKKVSVTFEQYLQAYEQRWNVNPTQLLQLPEYDRSLYTAWDLSYSRLKSDDPNAALLLGVFAYFDNQSIWYELLCAGLTPSSPPWLQQLLSSRINFENAITTLVDSCFLEVQPMTQSYSMHNCIHDWTRCGLNKSPDEYLHRYAFDCVYRTIDSKAWGSFGHIRYARLVPHAVHLVHPWLSSHQPFYLVQDDWVKEAQDIAQLLTEQVQLAAAEQLYQQILDGRESIYGPDDPSALRALHGVAYLRQLQGKIDDAEKMYLRAWERLQKVLGPTHRSTLKLLLDLVYCYFDQGKYEEAEATNSWVLAEMQKTQGSMSTDALRARQHLAALRRQQGRLDEAESMFLELLVDFEKVCGPDHASIDTVAGEIGLTYEMQNRLEDAERMFLRAFSGFQKRQGDDHPETQWAKNDLIRIYRIQGKKDKLRLYTNVG